MSNVYEESFAGDTLQARPHGLDFEIFVNNKSYGVYLTAEAGIAAAKASIIRELEDKK